MRLNIEAKAPRTHEGGPASTGLTPLQELERTVMTCLLWEDSYYEKGKEQATRIHELVMRCDPSAVATLAIWAREQMKLRHVPLYLTYCLTKHPADPKIAPLLERIIQRADEMTEFLAIYYADGGPRALDNQVKKGLARAFKKFDEYQLGKYDRKGKGVVRLRDVLFLSHAKPTAFERWTKVERKAMLAHGGTRLNPTPSEALYAKVAQDSLATPDTWEVALSAGADKKETFERLLAENRLGYLALLRNLSGMEKAGVSQELISSALLKGAAKSKALPFRFLAAARACPSFTSVLETAMFQASVGLEKLPGRTLLLIDVSGSMEQPLSRKSDMVSLDAASALAVLLSQVCEQLVIATFSQGVKFVTGDHTPFGLIQAISNSQPHGGTYLAGAVNTCNKVSPAYERIVVVTDEQSHDGVADPLPESRAYLINVAGYQHGVGYGKWVHVSGWSEGILAFIRAYEGV